MSTNYSCHVSNNGISEILGGGGGGGQANFELLN